MLRFYFFCALLSMMLGFADVCVVMEYPYDLRLDTYEYPSEELSSWQLLDHHFRQRGERLFLSTLSDEDIPRLCSIDVTTIIFMNYPYWRQGWPDLLARFPAKKILLCFEPRTVLPDLYHPTTWSNFDAILTWDTSLLHRRHAFHFCYPSVQPLQRQLRSFRERRLLTQISGNKRSDHKKELYSKRRAVIDYFERHHGKDFTFFGNGWGSEFRNYGGSVDDKSAVLQRFKFSICFENMRGVHGYVTEKIFDCFSCGCIPVYWGASDIARYIPRECFVDWRDFKSIRKLYAYLAHMSESEYLKYIHAIRRFLSSQKAKRFSVQSFVEKVLAAEKHVHAW